MKYKISKNVLWRVVDGEVVLADPDNDEYSYLNSTGAEIWQMIAKGNGLDEIVEKLSKEYATPAETIKKDTQTIIKDLVKSKLIVKSSL